jgi:DNA-binding IclR family transcriptional regulator
MLTRVSDSRIDERNKSLAVRRALTLVDVICRADSPLTLADIASASGINKSTALRLLGALKDFQLVEQEDGTGRYRLGLKTVTLGQKYLATLDLRAVAAPHLRALAEQTQETVHLVVFDFPDIVYVDKVDSARPVRMASAVGSSMPAYCTSAGKAVLASSPESVVEAVIAAGLPPRTPHTITTADALRSDLAVVRRRGWALDDMENGLFSAKRGERAATRLSA